MEDFTMRQSYKLPSLGKIYKEKVPEEVTLRSMTVNEEMMRLGVDDTFQGLAKLIDACIETPLPISSYDMCLGDFTFLYQRLRVVTYGDIYPMECTCPHCRKRNSLNVKLTDVPVDYYTDDILKYKTFKLPITGKEVTINAMTPRMLDSIQKKFKQLNEETNGAVQSDIILKLQCMIDQVDGERPTMEMKEILLQQLPMRDINKIKLGSSNFTDAIGVIPILTVECEECGMSFETAFRQGSDFFRPEETF